MNLYRNFGCMLETWMVHGYPDASSFSEDTLEKQQDTNSSDSASTCSIRFTGTPQRSESEDSGVDVSNVGSPKTFRSPNVLTSEVSHTFNPAAVCEITEEDVQPASPSSSPSPSICSSSSSSSSSSLCFSAAQGSQNLSRAEDRTSVEQALDRIRPDRTRPGTVETGSLENVLDRRPRRRSNTTSLSRSVHTGVTGLPQRTRRPHTDDQDSPAHIVLQDDGNNGEPVEGVCDVEPDWDGLSPGLVYLEKICRMLEEIARLQQHNQNLQDQVDNIRIHNQTVRTQEPESSSRLDKKLEPLRLEERPGLSAQAFRRRTASDTWAFLKNRRKPKAEPFNRSTEVLLEEPDGKLGQPVETEPKKKSSSLKQRISSLKKNNQINPSRSSSLHGERSMLRVFRNRSKTTRL